MSRPHTLFRCEACASSQARWSGRCPVCGEWNSLREQQVLRPAANARAQALGRRSGSANGGPTLRPLPEVDLEAYQPVPTGIGELDRVLAGGLLPGSTTLLGGEPGTGKSTLLLQALASMAGQGKRCLLVAAEESAPQVRRRARRLGADVAGVFVVQSVDLREISAAMAALHPDVAAIDSVQAVSDPELGPTAGSVAQVRGCAEALASLAKGLGAALVLVGHVTKDGTLAGPRALEHLVDTVLSFEGDRYLSLRSLRAVKHRFGPTGETGLFEMGEAGLAGVPDPSSLFLGDRLAGSAGSAVAVPVEGYRPLLVEVQALVGRPTQVPRRLVTGLDANRVGFLVAVLDRRAGVLVGDRDVYVSVAGGARAAEPAADLAICLAMASSLSGVPVPADMVAIGEVGLGGEVRRVSGMAKRLAEAERLGFGIALVPDGGRCGRLVAGREPALTPGVSALRQLPVSCLSEAIAVAFGGKLGARDRVGRGAAPLTGPANGLASASAGQVERGNDRGTRVDRAGAPSQRGA